MKSFKKFFGIVFVLTMVMTCLFAVACDNNQMDDNNAVEPPPMVVLGKAPTVTYSDGQLLVSSAELRLEYSESDADIVHIGAPDISADIFAGTFRLNYSDEQFEGALQYDESITLVSNPQELNDALEGTKKVILIKNGEYVMQVVVERDIVLIGQSVDGVLIKGPEDYKTLTDVSAEVDRGLCGLVSIKNASVLIKNLTIVGNPELATEGYKGTNIFSSFRYGGVVSADSNVTLSNIRILDITFNESHKGMQNGYAVFSIAGEENKELVVQDCEMVNFNKSGICAWTGMKKITVFGTKVEGFGSTDKIAQNGIIFSCLADIRNNSIKGINYEPEAWTSVGIFSYLNPQYNESIIEDNVFENVELEFYHQAP